jgi:hypothetical protein
MILSDFTQAFDHADRSQTIEILNQHKIPPQRMNVHKAQLTNAYNKTYCNEEFRLTPINKGVPQGDPTAPTVFSKNYETTIFTTQTPRNQILIPPIIKHDGHEFQLSTPCT